ncbi:AMP-binding protein [Actinocorallia sp. B10E7]|uniref:AMP-binding protein n=1 Tax=Actinocorallia sp. B10E7 TaxID=3153558 RepID=UPI00325CECD0
MSRVDLDFPGILDWLEAPRADRGVTLLDDEGRWRRTPYTELAFRTRTMAASLAEAGVTAGEVVSIVHRNGPGFVEVFFGALALGAIPSPVVPPGLFQNKTSYEEHVSAILDVAAPRAVVVEESMLHVLEPLVLARTGSPPLVPGRVPRTGPLAEIVAVDPASTCLLQFTSGSSAAPKGVEVSRSALEAQLELLGRWLGYGPDRGVSTWLPIHHDMGLVGNTLPSVVTGSDLQVMQPPQFIQGAARWLRVLGSGRFQITAVPPFALAHILRRVRARDLEGCDFSALEALVVGAEPIDPGLLDATAEFLAPFGLRREALLPAYGLAEATLAVTGKLPGIADERVRVDRSRLRLGDKAVAETEILADGSFLELVSCGSALPGAEVSVHDEHGDPVEPGVLGEIVVGGRALADGYRGVTGARWKRFRTGDAGFVWNGGLYVVGRLGDGMKVRGVQVFAEDLESLIARSGALGVSRCTVLLGALDGRDTAAVLVVRAPGPWAEKVVRTLRSAVGAARILVLSVTRDAMRRTSSGKPMRRAMFRDLADGSIGGVTVYDSLTVTEGAGDDG